jgi:DNA-directed RNA polymerase subunit RPC12/RpoP
MPTWIELNCPTCGANLHVDSNTNRFSCAHCGNAYLLAKKAGDIAPAEREQPAPITTYTHQLQQWLKVGEYEIFVHQIMEETTPKERLLFVNLEYRNTRHESLSCRRNQWVLFDAEGYTYDPATNTSLLEARERPALTGERFINPGMRLRGWIVFKLPEHCIVDRLQFLTGFLGTKTAEFLLQS